MNDELRDHIVVILRYLIALISGSVDTHTKAARSMYSFDLSRAGTEIILRILGVYAAFYRMSAETYIFLLYREREPACNKYLLLYEVDAGLHFGDGVFDLDTRVHLHEVEVFVLIDEELDCSGVVVAARLCRFDCRFAHFLAELGCHYRARGLLKHLLITALAGAVALSEMYHIPVLVREYLYLDVARINDELLDIYLVIAEEAERFFLCRG